MSPDGGREAGSAGPPPAAGEVNAPGEPAYADPMELESTRLMAAAKAGSREAFDELVLKVRGRAFQVARALVGSNDDAMDLTQEAFLKTYRARDTFRDGEPFLPWFHRILRNTCFSFLRKHRRLKKSSIHGDEDEERGEWEIESPAPDPSAAPERGETAALFWSGFEELGARDREILTLRHFEDLSYKEIAHALSIPEGTVMSRLFHARRRLRERLSPYLTGALSDYADTM